MNFKIAIVEDDKQASDLLSGMIYQYQKNNSSLYFEISLFSSASAFIFSFSPAYDLIFLDIEMPGINGMDAAKKIREKDKNVLLVFVTNLAQYAVEGYSVHAYDFILKPVNYPRFSMKFERICTELSHQKNEKIITVSNKSEERRISINDILYIEVSNHHLIIHMPSDSFTFRCTMNEMEKKLIDNNFSRCSNSFLVNLKYVSDLKGEFVLVGKESLRISQTRRTYFLADFASYIGGSK